MKFEDYKFDEKIVLGLMALGFRRPTDIQHKSIPNILKGEDLLAVAQTGTGKTAAFAIPVIDMIYLKKKRARRKGGAKCLILVPTHELALQLEMVFKKIAKFTSVRIMSLIGGVDQQPQIDQLERGVDIVIATPGRMFDLISQGHLRTHQVEILILDEADHMLDLGFIDDIKGLLHNLPRRRQTLFFSATINQKIKKIAYSLVRQSAIRIQLSPKDPVAKNIEHAVMFVEMDDKRVFLERIIKENPDDKILVFVRTKVRAERVCKAMARVDIESLTLHGDKTQEERTKVLGKFRRSEVMLLIATDISARGIDIPDIQMVINYDLPDESENYVHRVGRTGRGRNKGEAFSFCAPQEREKLEEIQSFLDKSIEVIPISKKEYKEITKPLKREVKENDISALMDEIEDLKKKRK